MKISISRNQREGWYVGHRCSWDGDAHVRIQKCVFDKKPPVRSRLARHKYRMFSAGTFAHLGVTLKAKDFK